MQTSLLLLLAFASYSSLLVVAAPNKSTQEKGLIGPENSSQDETELISAATTCQTAILRYIYNMTDAIQQPQLISWSIEGEANVPIEQLNICSLRENGLNWTLCTKVSENSLVPEMCYCVLIIKQR